MLDRMIQMTVHKISATVAATLALVATMAVAHAAGNRLVVVTSYPPEMTDAFKSAFIAKNPSVSVEIISKKTSSGLKYIIESAGNNKSDIFWASAPDAFEVLKGNSLLAKYTSSVKEIAKELDGYPINDPDGYYSGFALSGYGLMWNKRYAKAYKLPTPTSWDDLAKPVYHGHVGLCAPSRSGTTHLTIETILQGKGWQKGWQTIRALSGNAKTITERSFGVPDGVNSGSFGVGVVIDFFGLQSIASGFPTDFRYPNVTTLVPANVGIIANAPDKKVARKFIDFLLSPAGQQLLFSPEIMRLPVRKAAYAKAPKGLPNPFKGEIKSGVRFDTGISKARYNVVNSLFDVMITYRLNELRTATKAIQDAQAAINTSGSPNPEAVKLVNEAKALVNKLPINEAKALDPDFAAIFKTKRKKASDKVTGRQAEIEQTWDSQIVQNYRKATKLAKTAHSML